MIMFVMRCEDDRKSYLLFIQNIFNRFQCFGVQRRDAVRSVCTHRKYWRDFFLWSFDIWMRRLLFAVPISIFYINLCMDHNMLDKVDIYRERELYQWRVDDTENKTFCIYNNNKNIYSRHSPFNRSLKLHFLMVYTCIDCTTAAVFEQNQLLSI